MKHFTRQQLLFTKTSIDSDVSVSENPESGINTLQI